MAIGLPGDAATACVSLCPAGFPVGEGRAAPGPLRPWEGGSASLQGNALPSRTPSSLPRGTGRSPPPLRWAGNAGPWASVGVGGRRAVAHCPLDSCVHIHKYVCVCVCTHTYICIYIGIYIHIILGDYRVMMSPYLHLSFASLCWKAGRWRQLMALGEAGRVAC